METLQINIILYTFADYKYTIPTWIVILNSFDLDFLNMLPETLKSGPALKI